MFTIRPFIGTDEEFQAIIEINNLVWPRKYSVVTLKEHDSKYDKNFFSRLIATSENRIVGYATFFDPWYSSEPDYYHLDIKVHPEFRKQGIGSTLLDRAQKTLLNRELKTLNCDTYEGHKDSIEFLTKRGFSQAMRLPQSLLDVKSFQSEKFDDVLKKVQDEGIRILTIEEYKKINRKWEKNLWDLHWECLQDVPTTTEISRMPFDTYKTTVIQNLDMNYFVVALDKKKLMGLTILTHDKDDPKKMNTSLTGVIRSYRRKKIATALKVINILRAKNDGIETIETENAEENPMFQLNLVLGFVDQPARLCFTKKY